MTQLSNKAKSEIKRALMLQLPEVTEIGIEPYRGEYDLGAVFVVHFPTPIEGRPADAHFQLGIAKNAIAQRLRGRSLLVRPRYEEIKLNYLCTCPDCDIKWLEALPDEVATAQAERDYTDPVPRKVQCAPCHARAAEHRRKTREAAKEEQESVLPAKALSGLGFAARMRKRRRK